MNTFLLSIAFFLTVIAFNFFRGVAEGMIMTQPADARHDRVRTGVRAHKWFPLYHALVVVRGILGFSVGALLLPIISGSIHTGSVWIFLRSLFSPLLLIVLSFLVGWQVFESAYVWARYADSPPAFENLLGLDIEVYREDAFKLRAMLISVALAGVVWL